MTTNATLIDRHISFLVKNDFHITISLDGSKQNQNYRVFHNGKNSFDKVFRNIKLIREKYPDFFEINVSFNSVLHNRNSVEEIHKFDTHQRHLGVVNVGGEGANGVGAPAHAGNHLTSSGSCPVRASIWARASREMQRWYSWTMVEIGRAHV